MSNLNLNKVILAGRLTSDVELKQTTTGVSVCSFTLAVNRKFSANGQQQTDFIQCQAWRQTAEFISKYFKKGSALCISGSIQTRSWTDSNNQKRYATEVVADEAMFVDGKNDSQGADVPNYEEMNADDDCPF
jgi:single-strand DNA-binding protein